MSTSEDILSQEELDALLKDVPDEQGEIAPPPAPGTDRVRSYNLATDERIVRARMPTLELLNERFARALRGVLEQLIRRPIALTPAPISVRKYGEFIASVGTPASLNLMTMEPLRGTALFVLAPDLVFSVVDNLFGGDGRIHTRVEGRAFTPTEQRFVNLILEAIASEYRKAWEQLYPLDIAHLRTEQLPQFAAVATPGEAVVICQFSVEIGTGGGDFHLCMPWTMLEPLRALLYRNLPDDGPRPDDRWPQLLAEQVQAAEMELVATLARVDATIGQLLRMKPGDVIPLDLDGPIETTVDGMPVFACRHGVSNGRYAIRIDEILALPPNAS